MLRFMQRVLLVVAVRALMRKDTVQGRMHDMPTTPTLAHVAASWAHSKSMLGNLHSQQS